MDNAKWRRFYSSDRTNTLHTFVKIMTGDGEHFFFAVKDFHVWQSVIEHCINNSTVVQDLELQFRSNKVTIDVSDSDAIYLIRSAMGSPGMATKLYITVGLLKDNVFTKYRYLYPELIMEHEFEDSVEECFPEALLYDEEKTKNRQK